MFENLKRKVIQAEYLSWEIPFWESKRGKIGEQASKYYELDNFFFAYRDSNDNARVKELQAWGKTVTETENYKVLTIDIDYGMRECYFLESEVNSPASRQFNAQQKERRKYEAEKGRVAAIYLSKSVPFVRGNILHLSSGDTINLSGILPRGWVIAKVQRLEDKFLNTLGVVMCHPDHLEDVQDVHRLSAADYRESGSVQCLNVSAPTSESVYLPGHLQCEREIGHLGDHQAFHYLHEFSGTTDEFHSSWQEPTHFSHYAASGEFGFKNLCPHCGYVTMGSADANQVCPPCAYWIEQHQIGAGFVIDGEHFRPSENEELNGKIERLDGSVWYGNFAYQGKVPAHMRHLFPDNARFIELRTSDGTIYTY